MSSNDERDFAEEEFNRAEMEDGDICREESPVWVAGVCYVSGEDVATVYDALAGTGKEITCERCGGVYSPDESHDVYA